MNALLTLLEQLVTLSAPSVVALQSLLGVTLVQVPNANTLWRFHEAHPAAGPVARVDYREPGPGAAELRPFLVLDLRGAPFHLQDIEERYGTAQISDLSAHHPQFTGYRFSIAGHCVTAAVDSQTHAVLSVTVDYSSASAPCGQPPGAANANTQRAFQVLRTALATEARWIKVHAAEALLSIDEPQEVLRVFEAELATKGGEPEYRIGIWRVLAQAARDAGQRQQWTARILAAFLDTGGPDRLHAAETLAKLGYHAGGREADAFDLVARTGPGPFAANAQWTLANSGRADAELRLAGLLGSADGGTRGNAAYAIRHLPSLSAPAWDLLAKAVLTAPRAGDGRAYVVSAAFVHAPEDQKARFKGELLAYVRTGTSDEKYEACAALAKAGHADDLPMLIALLDHADPDVRVGAAQAIVRIDRREPR